MLRTIFAWTIFIPWTLFVMLTGMPLSFLNPDLLHNYARLWARLGLLISGVQLVISGQENIPAEGAVIYMPNHQSAFDILVLFAGLPGQFRWLAKEELFKIPMFGLYMKACGYVAIDRSNRNKALQSMKTAARRIHDGTSVVIFPEGTRSVDGRLLPFKKGGFMLALQAEVPIVPVAIDGSWKIQPKNSRRVTPGTIRVTIGAPVPTEGRTTADRDTLMAEVLQPIDRVLSPKEHSR